MNIKVITPGGLESDFVSKERILRHVQTQLGLTGIENDGESLIDFTAQCSPSYRKRKSETLEQSELSTTVSTPIQREDLSSPSNTESTAPSQSNSSSTVYALPKADTVPGSSLSNLNNNTSSTKKKISFLPNEKKPNSKPKPQECKNYCEKCKIIYKSAEDTKNLEEN